MAPRWMPNRRSGASLAGMSFFRSKSREADLALAGLLAAFGLAELWLVHVGPKSIAVPATAVAALALSFRRVAPLLTVTAVLGAIAAESLLGVSLQKPDAPLLMALVAVYTAGAYLPLRDAVAGLALAIAGIGASFAGSSTNGHSDFAFTSVVVTAGWLVGRGFHGRVTQAAALVERTQRLEQEAEAERAAAVAEERRRIARDLHDVIAHSVSVMVVQAGAAEDVFDRDPAAVLEPIRAVQETGRGALVEISRLLGLLREDGAELGLTPQPRIEDLPGLVAQAEAAGLRVELCIEGATRALPLGIDLSVYRIAQEALTNARKHSANSQARILLRYSADAVELTVENDGVAVTNGHRGGHGLIGMRERVAVFGGTLDAGPRRDGGFRVVARLPVPAGA
jgi:signal transduction histidine kinase